MGETNPGINLVVPYNTAQRGDVELHDRSHGNDVLMSSKVHEVVGLWNAEEGELRVDDVCEKPEDVFCV